MNYEIEVEFKGSQCVFIIQNKEMVQYLRFILEENILSDLYSFSENCDEIKENLKVIKNLDFKSNDIESTIVFNESLSFSLNNKGVINIENSSNIVENKTILTINNSFIDAINIIIKHLESKTLKKKGAIRYTNHGAVYKATIGDNENVEVKKINLKDNIEFDVLKTLKNKCSEYYQCVYDIIEEENNELSIVMESLEFYRPLSDYISKKNIINIDIIIMNLCKGLKLIHSYKIAHRQINPKNIMVNIETGQIKYINFEMSCLMNKCGKNYFIDKYLDPNYIRKKGLPQMFKNSLYLAQQADLWSLGIVIYQIITGRLPINFYEESSVYFNEYSFLKDENRDFIKYKLEKLGINIQIDNLLSFSERNYFC